MIRYLRTMSTPRLLAAAVGVVIAAIAGSAIAIAAAGRGPVPPRRSLPQALRLALSAPSVSGVSARVSFTNSLIDASQIQGTDPLLSGGSGRLWIAPGKGLRLELQSESGDAQLVVRPGLFWAYDPTSNTVYEARLPAAPADHPNRPAHDVLPTVAQIQAALQRLSGHAHVSGAIPGDVAGRPTYTVRLSPADPGGLLGALELSWDARQGIPLRFAVYARRSTSPVLELRATDVSYGPVAASVFALTPPAGAHVVHMAVPAGPALVGGATRPHRGARPSRAATHAPAPKALGFALDDPATLAGLPRTAVHVIAGGKAAVVVYGQGLGGVYVIEHAAPSGGASAPAPAQQGDHPGLSLGTATVNGAQAQELSTALGTVLRFSRGGVGYTIIGSVPAAVAESVARGL